MRHYAQVRVLFTRLPVPHRLAGSVASRGNCHAKPGLPLAHGTAVKAPRGTLSGESREGAFTGCAVRGPACCSP